jgi:hypothetical protein
MREALITFSAEYDPVLGGQRSPGVCSKRLHVNHAANTSFLKAAHEL